MTTRIGWFSGLAAVVAVCELAAGQGMSVNFDELYRLRDGRGRRVSSADADWKDGNNDRIGIGPGETATIAEMDGPGVIRHIWFTIHADDPKWGRSVVLRMYWDGSDQPAVESPLGDFFAVGHGAVKWVNSIPVSVTSDGRAYNCYWPMPFRKSARITVSNDSDTYQVRSLYYYVDYEEVERLPEDTAYFHAQYRQEYPADKGDYLLCDTVGRGHYIGTVLSAQFRTKSWFGEGDDRFYIDGETEPSLRGTGTEDYFCDAWGFREFMRPYYGVVMMDGYEVGDRVTAYRWHIPDPIPFRKSLKVTIEHKGVMFSPESPDQPISTHYERPDLFSSVAFWYQVGQAKRFATLPPANERIVQEKAIEMEAFVDAVKTTPADTNVHNQQGAWSGGKQLYARNMESDGVLVIPFELDEPIEGLARLKITKSWDYGIYKISLNGEVLPGLQKVDLFVPHVEATDFNIGYRKLPAGEHTLKLECLGKHPDSKGFMVGVDAIAFEQLTPYLHDEKND